MTTAVSNIKSVLERAKQIIFKKDEEILFLKTGLKAAMGGKEPILLKMPGELRIENFPDIQKVKIENADEPQKVKVTNLGELKVSGLNLKFPKIQDVRVVSDEKTSKWVPTLITHAVKTIVDGIWKRIDMGVKVKVDDEDKLRPQAVIIVDVTGKPVNFNQQAVSMIPFPGGGGSSGSPIIAESLDQYHVSDGDETGSTKYYGFLTKEGHWYIMQNNTSANTYRYAKGSSLYSTNWTNRASLSYGYFDVVF